MTVKDKRSRIEQILEWRLFHGKTYREIARLLGLSVGGAYWLATQGGAPKVGSGRRKAKQKNVQ